MKTNKWLALGMVSALSMGLAACGDDSGSESPTDKKANGEACEKAEECVSNYCSDDKKCADSPHAAACDFDKAYVDANAKYETLLALNKLDAQTAVDRSFFGLIALASQPDIQAILKRLKLKDQAGVVSFKAFWDNEPGIFSAMAAKKSNPDAVDQLSATWHNLAPYTEVWYKEIDKTLTIDDVLNALIKTKTQLESLAEGFVKAGDLLKDGKGNSTGGCDFNKLEFYAQDMYSIATVLYAASATISLASNYDFNISIAELATHADRAGINDGTCESRTELVKLLEPHLWKKASTTREVPGLTGDAALKEMTKAAQSALLASPGSLFNLSSVVKNDAKVIIDGILDGSGSFGNLVVPAINMDLSKMFSNLVYRTEALESAQCDQDKWAPDALYKGVKNVYDYPVVTYTTHVLGKSVFVSDPRVDGNAYGASDDYSSSFSDAWSEMDVDDVFNSKQYLEFLSVDD